MKHPPTAHQSSVAERVLDEESRSRRHLVVHLSGAHAYGFPSPDSDLDLKAIHIERTRRLLGFEPPSAVRNRLEVIDGVEIDYTSNELSVAVRGILRGDGNMFERVFSASPERRAPALTELAELARRNLSRRVHHHYRGFANAQRKAVLEAEAPSAKRVLYVLRTALTGVHLLNTGQCVPDLTALYEEYGFGLVPQLVQIKQQGERQALPAALVDEVVPVMDRAFSLLERAREGSSLPDEPAEVDALEHWVVEQRIADLDDEDGAEDGAGP
ncbi:MAG: nucleotidyltransferase domain-containing protein [Deltaproteobacteria bacterium]|nr:nucleotidyltransferase domain-containing protein [Deltaproteobacteria bacterium]